MAKTVVGLFDSHLDAENVVREITNLGVARENISVVANQNTFSGTSTTVDTASGTTVSGDTTTTGGTGITSGFVHGAEQGAIWGGIGGLVLGLAALAIPGFGPIIAAGPIAAALTGAGLGAAAGGLVGSLGHIGVPEEDAHLYAEGVRRGSTLVTAQTNDEAIAQRISDIMHNHNAIDIEERGAIYKQTGYAGSSIAPAYTADEITAERNRYTAPVPTPAVSTASAFTAGTTELKSGETTIPVVEEELVVGKREVERGGARVRTFVTETPVQEQVTLHEERVTVERHPVDRAATATDFKEGTIEVRAESEEAVVSKTARVVEEVTIGKEVSDRVETVSDTVRRTDVDVEQIGTTGATGSSYSAFDTDFRNHYTTNYASTGKDYNTYQPAYQYGHTLATDPQYANMSDWNEVETRGRSGWDTNRYGAWDQFKDSIHHAWDATRRSVHNTTR